MKKEEAEKMAGMHKFAMSLLHDGTHRSNAVWECMNMCIRTDLDMKVISREALEEMEKASRPLAIADFRAS